MQPKISELRERMAAGDWRGALRIAKSFHELGEHKEPIRRAWAAIQSPATYQEMGKDPDALIASGIAALKERYGEPEPSSPVAGNKFAAVYVRVSSRAQDHKSQLPELERWVETQDAPVRWFTDKASGKTMDRTGWQKLEAAIRAGKVSAVVVWRLDRLGRTAAGLTALFEELRDRKINLVSIRDGLNLSTAAGRLMANVIASVAAYETEVRGERVRAGIDVARAAGKTWGGSKPGVRKKVTDLQLKMIRRMKQEGEPITAIAGAVKLSRPTVYDVLAGK